VSNRCRCIPNTTHSICPVHGTDAGHPDDVQREPVESAEEHFNRFWYHFNGRAESIQLIERRDAAIAAAAANRAVTLMMRVLSRHEKQGTRSHYIDPDRIVNDTVGGLKL
jgi:hypothetical protein